MDSSNRFRIRIFAPAFLLFVVAPYNASGRLVHYHLKK